MRELVEDRVNQTLEFMMGEEPNRVKEILDFDLGFWNADDGPRLTKKFVANLVKSLDDSELMDLYDCMNSY